MNNFEKGKELEDKTADRLDAVGVKNNKNGGPGDGGIDISGVAAGNEIAIQCKNWADKIGRNVVDELAGVLSKRETVGKLVSWWRHLDILLERGKRHGSMA